MNDADFMILAMIEAQGQVSLEFRRTPMALRIRLANLLVSGNLVSDDLDELSTMIDGVSVAHFALTDLGRSNLSAYTGERLSA